MGNTHSKHTNHAQDDAGVQPQSALYAAVHSYVQGYMRRYDMSHDFSHIERVVKLAKYIMNTELKNRPSHHLDSDLVVIAAYLHDVGDKKYALPGEEPDEEIARLLVKNGAESSFIDKVLRVVKNVSYSNEIKNREEVSKVLMTLPELGVVQDADRLDAIGAVGISRCFAYGAAKAPDRGLQGSVDHFVEKLEKLEGMIKTETGRRLARERTARVQTFREWWEAETAG